MEARPYQTWRDREPLDFDFHGVGLRVSCNDPAVSTQVAEDFAYFRVEEKPQSECGIAPDFTITGVLGIPAYDDVPPLKASMYTPRNICYSQGHITYIDYFGRALARYDRGRGTLDVQSDDPQMLREVIFLSTLSRMGEALERHRMHRVHSLAIESGGEAALFALPSGGGKTSLAMEFLRSDLGYRILSEDSPLVNSSGEVLPFPLRFGIKGERPEGFADRHITLVDRMEFDPKYLISLDAFDGRIATGPARPRFLFIGHRTLGTACAIRRAGFMVGLRCLMREMVVGVGLYQGVEFLFRSSAREVVGKTGLFVSRLRRALSLLRRCEIYTVELGRDRHRNAADLVAFLTSQRFGTRFGAPGP